MGNHNILDFLNAIYIHTIDMNKLDKDYQNLLQDILNNGIVKEDRTGTGTKSLFGRQIRHQMKDGFPLLTTKRMALNSMMYELKWFLKGDTNIKYLVDNGCNIWNGDAYKAYKTKYGYDDIDAPLSMGEFITKIKTDELFAEEWGELGPIYGKQWRSWSPVAGDINKGGKDQIANLIKELKTNPDSRRLMVSAWNVGELSEMTLPPCHYGFQVYTRELDGQRYLSLMWNQRSVDTFLGLPFNIASYGLLLELIAKEVNMIPDELIGNLGDVHLYSNHLDQAKKQIMREPYNLPAITKLESNLLEGEFDCDISYYECWPAIKAPLSN